MRLRLGALWALALFTTSCKTPIHNAYSLANKNDAAVNSTTSANSSEFVVNVTLSDKARDEMARRHETVIVAALCSKTLSSDVPHKKEEMMPDSLGSVDVEVSPGHAAHFRRERFDQGETKGISADRLRLLINVVSGRRSSQDNLLACVDAQEGTLESFEGKVIPVHCVLIHGEQDQRNLEQLRGIR